jgi:elongation factor G
MEKYFDDPSTITEEEIVRAIRKGTISMDWSHALWFFF